jgi:glycosyltransferase involved in cell wall biosynthesis
MKFTENILIFDDKIDGHHLEYVHHLFIKSLSIKDKNFFFLLPPEFELLKKNFIWPKTDNIHVFHLSIKEISSLKNKNGILKSLIISKIIKKAVNKHNIQKIFLISLISVLPILPFFLDKKIKVSGIIYLIYLYRWKNSNFLSKGLDLLKYFILSKFEIFDNLFLLNDQISPVIINKKFKTTKFKYLPDPINVNNHNAIFDLRSKLKIDKSSVIYSHFGALNERKGTLEILKAISLSNLTLKDKYNFIFAGKINRSIESEFYQLVEQLKNKAVIHIYNEFVDSDFIASLCSTSNYLLIPYKNVCQSSGVLSYAAAFKVPVIAPRLGLLGKLIKRNRLGYLLKDGSSNSIKDFLNSEDKFNDIEVSNNYTKGRSINDFSVKILNSI